MNYTYVEPKKKCASRDDIEYIDNADGDHRFYFHIHGL